VGDNLKMDLREIGWGGMNWIDLAQDRDQFLSSLAIGGSTRNTQLYVVGQQLER
jgi:hypothetical protein